MKKLIAIAIIISLTGNLFAINDGNYKSAINNNETITRCSKEKQHTPSYRVARTKQPKQALKSFRKKHYNI